MKLLKSEKLALAKIAELTINQGKLNTVITNEMFEQEGLKGRHLIVKATNGLKEKGLIYKVKNDDKYFRYQIQKSALCMFSDSSK
jgi:hypothetical protein